MGWNDVPKGHVPCLLRFSSDLLSGNRDLEAFSRFERTNSDFKTKGICTIPYVSAKHDAIEGRHVTYCFKDSYNKATGNRNQVHTRALHAEENAFLQVAKSGGQGVAGGYLFSTASPCELCAKKAYQLGIARVYYIDPYPGISVEHIFGAGSSPPRVNLFSGVIGRAYHDLYGPLMAYKDEMDTLLGLVEETAPLFSIAQARDAEAPKNAQSARQTSTLQPNNAIKGVASQHRAVSRQNGKKPTENHRKTRLG
jgi:deoxycytidylate deaminase